MHVNKNSDQPIGGQSISGHPQPPGRALDSSGEACKEAGASTTPIRGSRDGGTKKAALQTLGTVWSCFKSGVSSFAQNIASISILKNIKSELGIKKSTGTSEAVIELYPKKILNAAKEKFGNVNKTSDQLTVNPQRTSANQQSNTNAAKPLPKPLPKPSAKSDANSHVNPSKSTETQKSTETRPPSPEIPQTELNGHIEKLKEIKNLQGAPNAMTGLEKILDSKNPAGEPIYSATQRVSIITAVLKEGVLFYVTPNAEFLTDHAMDGFKTCVLISGPNYVESQVSKYLLSFVDTAAKQEDESITSASNKISQLLVTNLFNACGEFPNYSASNYQKYTPDKYQNLINDLGKTEAKKQIQTAMKNNFGIDERISGPILEGTGLFMPKTPQEKLAKSEELKSELIEIAKTCGYEVKGEVTFLGLQKIYTTLSLEYHPDKNTGKNTGSSAEEREILAGKFQDYKAAQDNFYANLNSLHATEAPAIAPNGSIIPDTTRSTDLLKDLDKQIAERKI